MQNNLENATTEDCSKYVSEVKQLIEDYSHLKYPQGRSETVQGFVFPWLYDCIPDWKSISFDNSYACKNLLQALTHPAFKNIPYVDTYECAKMLSRLIAFEEMMNENERIDIEMDLSVLDYGATNIQYASHIEATYKRKMKVAQFEKSLEIAG